MAPTLTYFSLLGVSEDAGQDEVEARYGQLADYLASDKIPSHLREWAAKQAALVDEAYAVLSDPDQREAARRRGIPAPQPPPAPPAAARRTPGRRRGSAAPPDGPHGRTVGMAARWRTPLAIGAAVGIAVLAGVVLSRSVLPGGSGGASVRAQQTAAVPQLDTKRVAALMETVQQDPKNTQALFDLGESFFQVNDWQHAIDWFTKLVAIDPNNVHARTDIGTSHFNLGQPAEAKASWLAALKLAPDDVQLHYNMGFLYANADPQDLPAAAREWQRVVELEPSSPLAQTVRVHLTSLAGTTPTTPPAGQTTPTPRP